MAQGDRRADVHSRLHCFRPLTFMTTLWRKRLTRDQGRLPVAGEGVGACTPSVIHMSGIPIPKGNSQGSSMFILFWGKKFHFCCQLVLLENSAFLNTNTLATRP